MSVRRFFVLGNDKTIADYAVEGDSYDPYKEDKSPFRISSMNTQEVLKVPASIPVIREMSSVATICNDSSITVDDNGVFDKVHPKVWRLPHDFGLFHWYSRLDSRQKLH